MPLLTETAIKHAFRHPSSTTQASENGDVSTADKTDKKLMATRNNLQFKLVQVIEVKMGVIWF